MWVRGLLFPGPDALMTVRYITRTRSAAPNRVRFLLWMLAMAQPSSISDSRTSSSVSQDDDALLQEMGYTPSFKREFTSLSTVCG